MVRIVVEGLYPAAYLDAPDDRGQESSNRERVMRVGPRSLALAVCDAECVQQEFLHRYEITRRQPMIGRVCQTAAALSVTKALQQGSR